MLPPNVTWFEVCIVYAAKLLCEQLFKDELHQEHRLGTASNNITGGGGA